MSSILDQSYIFRKLTGRDEPLIVLNRLREICPVYIVKDMDIDEVELDTRVAFEIIGFNPENFSEAFRKSWENSDKQFLSDFVYDVWRYGRE